MPIWLGVRKGAVFVCWNGTVLVLLNFIYTLGNKKTTHPSVWRRTVLSVVLTTRMWSVASLFQNLFNHLKD